MQILDKITEQTREDVAKRKKKVAKSDFKGFEDYQRDRRDLYESLKSTSASGWPAIIAEIKRASPSKGIIREDFRPVDHGVSYQENGAAAISVLTDQPFFMGDLQYMKEVARSVGIPVLRKDFIIDFYQIEEARAFGADAILLIATITSGSQLSELHHAATEAGLQCLVECYSEEDMQQLDFTFMNIFGVNNRNLNTFEVDVHRGIELLEKAPEGVMRVSESGLNTEDDIKLLLQGGVHAALIGEAFMKSDDPGAALAKLSRKPANVS